MSFASYLTILAQANGLIAQVPSSRTDGPEWLFYPGMLQESCSKWWSDFGTRATCHEGLDICFYRTGKGVLTPLVPGAKVPAMASGRVLNIASDLLGKSIVVSLKKEPDQEVVMVYSHLDTAPGLAPGDPVDQGDLIGRTFDTRKKQSKLLSHLHISCICLPRGVPADQMNWDLFADRERVFHINPVFVA